MGLTQLRAPSFSSHSPTSPGERSGDLMEDGDVPQINAASPSRPVSTAHPHFFSPASNKALTWKDSREAECTAPQPSAGLPASSKRSSSDGKPKPYMTDGTQHSGSTCPPFPRRLHSDLWSGRGLLAPAAQDRPHKWQGVLETLSHREGDYSEAWATQSLSGQLTGRPTARDLGASLMLRVQPDTRTTTRQRSPAWPAAGPAPHLPIRRRRPAAAAP